MYVPVGTAPAQTDPTQRILEAAELCSPGLVVSGWASLFARGADRLDGRDHRTGRLDAVDVIDPCRLGRSSGGSVTYHREGLGGRDVGTGPGVPLTVAERAALDAARWARDLTSAVIIVDSAAHAGLIDLQYLESRAASARGVRAIIQARQAISFADAATRSPWESIVRVIHVLEAGLPPPVVNIPVFDVSGRLVGIVDLLDPAAGLVTEIDGQQHRGRAQHRSDNDREEELEALGLVVVRADGRILPLLLGASRQGRAMTPLWRWSTRRGRARTRSAVKERSDRRKSPPVTAGERDRPHARARPSRPGSSEVSSGRAP